VIDTDHPILPLVEFAANVSFQAFAAMSFVFFPLSLDYDL
jgi:hypothetical protein